MNRGMIVVTGVGAVALVATIALFVAGSSSGPEITGKLSKPTIDFEARYKKAQADWRKGEPAFLDFKNQDKELTMELSRLIEEFRLLATSVKGLQGESEEEKKALPHLVASVEASARVPGQFMIARMNPAILSPKHWDSVRESSKKANDEWRTWEEKTRTLSR